MLHGVDWSRCLSSTFYLFHPSQSLAKCRRPVLLQHRTLLHCSRPRLNMNICQKPDWNDAGPAVMHWPQHQVLISKLQVPWVDMCVCEREGSNGEILFGVNFVRKLPEGCKTRERINKNLCSALRHSRQRHAPLSKSFRMTSRRQFSTKQPSVERRLKN